MTTQEIKSALLGSTIYHFDSWNGSRDTFTIGRVCFHKDGNVSIDDEDGRSRLFIALYVVEKLILTGKAREDNEVDHCHVYDDYTLEKKQAEQQQGSLFDALSDQTLNTLLSAIVSVNQELNEQYSLQDLICKFGEDYQPIFTLQNKVFKQIQKNELSK